MGLSLYLIFIRLFGFNCVFVYFKLEILLLLKLKLVVWLLVWLSLKLELLMVCVVELRMVDGGGVVLLCCWGVRFGFCFFYSWSCDFMYGFFFSLNLFGNFGKGGSFFGVCVEVFIRWFDIGWDGDNGVYGCDICFSGCWVGFFCNVWYF